MLIDYYYYPYDQQSYYNYLVSFIYLEEISVNVPYYILLYLTDQMYDVYYSQNWIEISLSSNIHPMYSVISSISISSLYS
jgi:hypothetical protein